MSLVRTFTVVPRLPKKIEKVRDVAHNLSWCWSPEAVELFFRIDRSLWDDVRQNPVRLLGEVEQERLELLSEDESFLAHLDRVWDAQQSYLEGGNWLERNPETPEGFNAAYFSAEFGIHESISIYSGGLGVLAGDFLKSASDLGLPLVGVGLLYREGYHSQYLNADGWQQERYPRNDFFNMPIALVRDEAGEVVTISVDVADHAVQARIWKCEVGRVPLYLLDCDFDANDQDEREITARLYGGDRDMRIRQEILLGMGGVQALRALDIHPMVYHMNEGHAAFMVLQRVQNLVQREGLSLAHAFEAVEAASVFTTHTPVAAGNDMFAPELIERYFGKWCESVGMSMHDLLGLGRQDPNDMREPFCLTVLAMRLSTASNGVSRLHGDTARGMWVRTYPGIPEDEVPITSITNGIHLRSFVSHDLAGLYDRYLGPGWDSNPSDHSVWEHMNEVPDAELWGTHGRRRERLVEFARRRLTAQLERRGLPKTEVRAASEALDPEVITIGFARRFATYKRAALLMSDPDRFHRLLTDAKRPIQLIVAGKAHPQDNQGKDLIRQIIHYIRKYNVRNQLIFLEDYDINVARYMVQGVDCWLNTPRRPMEASGTSGMKAAANGALNISVLDGWWCEAALLGENGFSIGHGEEYDSPGEQDAAEA
jgi:glycogen phosphorylase